MRSFLAALLTLLRDRRWAQARETNWLRCFVTGCVSEASGIARVALLRAAAAGISRRRIERVLARRSSDPSWFRLPEQSDAADAAQPIFWSCFLARFSHAMRTHYALLAGMKLKQSMIPYFAKTSRRR